MLFDSYQDLKSDKYSSALESLRGWDKRYTRGSRGAVMFEMFKLKLAFAIFGDDIGAGATDALGVGSGTSVAVRAVTKDGASRWWDDISTPVQEDRAAIYASAFRAAVDALETRLGADQTKWSWGAVHVATFKNQTLGNSGVAPIERIFNRGPFPADGGTALVNAVGHRPSDFSVRSVPSMRMVVDLSNLDASTLDSHHRPERSRLSHALRRHDRRLAERPHQPAHVVARAGHEERRRHVDVEPVGARHASPSSSEPACLR